jgi:cytoskeleton protein RodZ
MSDAVHERAAAEVADGVTAGRLLRRAREASGMHVAALAVSLKVPVRKLEALEADRHDLLTDVVFTRGLASSVCRALKIDPRPILDKLPQPDIASLVRNDSGLNTPFRGAGDVPPPTWAGKMARPVPLIVGALLLAALVLLVWPNSLGVKKSATSTLPVPASKAPSEADALFPPGLAPPAAVPAPVGPSSASSTLPVPVAAAASAPVAAGVPAVRGPEAAPATESPAQATATPAPAADAARASGLVVIRAKGESWVEVTDAKGAVALRKLLVPGESAGASGALPLQVTIGRADLTEVEVRGRPFDVRPLSRDNVARFEVK